jgi:hypothetical protein
MNEITSAATIFSLAQYISPGAAPGAESIGTSGANASSNTPLAAIGLNNAVNAIQNLASLTTGNVVPAAAYAGSNPTVTSVTVTATAETAKIVTIANIMAACINTTSAGSANCATLFAAATPPPNASVTSQPTATFGTAQDTIQAAYYMATNPIDAGAQDTACATATNLICLFNLATATPPFVGGLGTPPTDWTIGVAYTATGTCSDGTATGYNFISGPVKSAVDAYGNLWFINGYGGSTNVAALSPIGVPLYCAGNTYGGRGLTIDPSGNVWASFSATNKSIIEFPAPGQVPGTIISTSYSPAAAPTAIVSDGAGNIFFATYANTALDIYEIPSAATAISNVTTTSPGAYQALYMAVDGVGRIFAEGANSKDNIVELSAPSANITGYTVSGGTTTFTTTNTAPFTVGQSILLSGLSTLARQTVTVTAVNGSSFSSVTTATAATATDTGIAIVVPTGAASYTIQLVESLGANSYGLALDNVNGLYSGGTCCASTGNDLIKAAVNNNGTTFATAGGTTGNFAASAEFVGGSTGYRALTIDGAANIWFGNLVPSTDPTSGTDESPTNGVFSIGEIATSGLPTGSNTGVTFTNLSLNGTAPAAPDTCTSSTTGCPAGGGFQKASLNLTLGMSVDPSGDVWVLNDYAAGSTTSYSGTTITEVIGAAVPVVTPTSVGSANGTLASKP